jgi:hypothetical protein
MPIRIVKDDENQQEPEQPEYNESDTGGGGSSGGGMGSLFSFLPILLGLFSKAPKLVMGLVVIGAIFYFTKGGCSSGGSTADNDSNMPGRGATLDVKQYDKAEVYEPLDPSKTPLPSEVSLARFAPNRGDQGQQGSCVGWGSAYAARTILESAATGQDPNSIVFSPSFLYNQISLTGCQGAYINNAMEVMTQRGSLPLNQFPYSDQGCDNKPNGNQMQDAGQFKMRGYNRLSDDAAEYTNNINGIKQNLAQGAPVVIGMNVTQSFTQDMMGKDLWMPTQEDYGGYNSLGGHCMCIIGYDDNKAGGAFQIMNSWSPRWGKNGIGWVRYKDFQHFNKEAYGVYPMAKKGAAANQAFAAQIALVNTSTRQYIPLNTSSGNLFKTGSPIAKGTKFKIEFKNTEECYTYVFGQETDASSYVLFPYTPKHSPFCGITGYRIFPRKESLQADAVGNKDFFVVVVSKSPIDFNKMNASITASRQATYQGKVNEALAQIAIKDVQFAAQNGVISFQSATKDNQAVAMVIEVDKN